MQKKPEEANAFSSDIRWEKLKDAREGRTDKEQGGQHFARGVDS